MAQKGTKAWQDVYDRTMKLLNEASAITTETKEQAEELATLAADQWDDGSLGTFPPVTVNQAMEQIDAATDQYIEKRRKEKGPVGAAAEPGQYPPGFDRFGRPIIPGYHRLAGAQRGESISLEYVQQLESMLQAACAERARLADLAGDQRSILQSHQEMVDDFVQYVQAFGTWADEVTALLAKHEEKPPRLPKIPWSEAKTPLISKEKKA